MTFERAVPAFSHLNGDPLHDAERPIPPEIVCRSECPGCLHNQVVNKDICAALPLLPLQSQSQPVVEPLEEDGEKQELSWDSNLEPSRPTEERDVEFILLYIYNAGKKDNEKP